MAGSRRGGRSRRQSEPPNAFTRVRRLAERGRYDAAAIHAVLDAVPSCVVAHVVDGRPVATPTLHWRIGERVYWHGSVASRMLRTNAAGGDVCLTVNLMDGWVLARSAFNHTVNYRAVMVFGRPEVVADADKARVKSIEVALDQCYDLLRQRRALREFGRDPDKAKLRDEKTVEGYSG